MTDREKSRGANWTIMVYVAADDVLANFAVGSLKQIKRVASQDADVVVAAQFDADGRRNIPRLIFDGVDDESGSIQDNKKDEIPYDTDMADPCALSNFIDWAYAHCKANHYCLILWGHGPELLIDDYPVGRSGNEPKKFLTPSDLRKALADTNLTRDGHRFEIVGIDSCCMSMVELACELSDYAEFMVASQEEVPDFSFPYDKLLFFGKSNSRGEIARACGEMPRLYIDGYRDYILTQGTKLESITLSSLSLKEVETVTGPLGRLADALMNSVHDKEKRQAVIDARADSKAFVIGLYVDLCDFCEQLRSQLSLKNIRDEKLISACKEISGAIRSLDDNAFVIANQAPRDKHCHGISIYFPFLTDSERNAMESPSDSLVEGEMGRWNLRRMDAVQRDGLDARNMDPRNTRRRGGVDVLNKGGVDVLNKGRIDVLNKWRRQRIEETEQYYCGLKLSQKTRWDEFIRHCWSRWLAENVEETAKSYPETEVSDILDQRYSAQQCALNLLSLCRDLEEDGKSLGTRAAT